MNFCLDHYLLVDLDLSLGWGQQPVTLPLHPQGMETYVEKMLRKQVLH
jgi:hypothetical protein